MAKKKEEQEEFDLKIEEDKTPKDSTDPNAEIAVEDKKEAPIVDDVEKKIKELQDGMARADKARVDAEERAARLEKEKTEAVTKSQTSESNAVSAKQRELEAAKVAIDSNVSALEDLYEKALEASDSKALREINTKLQKAIVKQERLEEATEQFSHWKKQQEEAAKQPRTQELPPSVKEWVNKNPKYNTDPIFKAEADTAHDAAIRRGYGFGTPAYIEFIDQRIEKIFGEPAAPAKKTEKEDEEQTFSASPSRGAADSGGGSGDKKTIKLTAAQVEAAETCGMTPVEYWQYLQKIKERK